MIQSRGQPRRPGNQGRRVRLKPANPFDLIRLIAHSQSDPRKAVAELVQNSLDAGALHVTITRQRRRGEVILSILDDGRGVFPELERPDALERIATNIGHSFKRNLSPAERQRQMMLGKYGIGILGFWCIGRELEMRTRVNGSELWQLQLVRDQPVAEVERVRQARMPLDEDTFTEIVIRGVHPAPARQLSGRRLGEYLGAELRGQLLARAVRLRIIDRIARGSAIKDFLVVPPRFQGRRLGEITELPVPGFAPATLELYLADPDSEREPRLALGCGGAVVCEELGAVDGYGLDPEIWSSRRLEGVIDFAALDVAPSTRRGFAPSPAADAFFVALRGLEPRLRQILDEERARQREQEDAHLVREIRNVFRPLARTLPQYDFFDIQSTGRGGNGDAGPYGEQLGATTPPVEPGPAAETATPQGVLEPGEPGDGPTEPMLFPPGPLHSVRVMPARCRLLPGATRGLAARAADEQGRVVTAGIAFRWQVIEGDATLAGDGPKATVTAGETLGQTVVRVTACQDERVCEADAVIEVVETLAGESPDSGVPDPRRAFDPTSDWRSRVHEGRWEYNAAHPDYRAVADDARQRLRYLIHLFAKEIVLHNYGEPNDDRLLERMVQVLTHIKPAVTGKNRSRPS